MNLPVSTSSHSLQDETDVERLHQHDTNMAANKRLTLEDQIGEIKKNAIDSNRKLANLESKIDKNQESLNNYIKTNDEALTKIQTKTRKTEDRIKMTESTVKTLEDRVSQMSDELEALAKNNFWVKPTNISEILYL